MGSKLMEYALKGKVVLVALVSLAVIGGATAMAASTTTGANLVQTLVGTSQTGSSNASSHATPRATGPAATCPGLPDLQRLAAQFSLSTTSTDDDMLALCALHQGTFTG